MGIHQIIGSQPAPRAATGRADADAFEAALADMTAVFSSDVANGRIGARHNSYEHRSRVLRQMTAQLSEMRTQDLVATS